MNDEHIHYLPFHALNEFMNSEYRLNVVRLALSALPRLGNEYRAPVDRLTRQYVQVPGFRNSAKAPVPVKARSIAGSFEKSPELVANIVAAWAASLPDLRQKVYDLLVERGWEVLPPEADRRRLPGFLPTWPRGEDFEVLNNAFKEKYPDSDASSDDVSLMVVWLSGRLPYAVEGEDEDEGEDEHDHSEE